VKNSTVLLLRNPSLKIRTSLRKDIFEANLKSESELWNLMIKEMWAGRMMADNHKVKFTCAVKYLRLRRYYRKCEINIKHLPFITNLIVKLNIHTKVSTFWSGTNVLSLTEVSYTDKMRSKNSKNYEILLQFNSCAAYYFCGYTFFQDSLVNIRFKRTMTKSVTSMHLFNASLMNKSIT